MRLRNILIILFSLFTISVASARAEGCAVGQVQTCFADGAPTNCVCVVPPAYQENAVVLPDNQDSEVAPPDNYFES